MSLPQRPRGLYVALCFSLAIPVVNVGQARGVTTQVGGHVASSPVLDAPFSADAVSTVKRTLRNGTRVEQSTMAHFYRDGAGRVRIEHTSLGLDSPRTMAERHMRTWLEIGDGGFYTLDPVTRTARGGPRELIGLANGSGRLLAVPVGGVRFLVFRRAQDWVNVDVAGAQSDYVRSESLGRRRIAGVETSGHRIAVTVSEAVGNDLPTELVDEVWESPELKIVIYSRFKDSRSGVIEYQMERIRRGEPPPELFSVPPDYTLDATPTPEDPWLSLIPAERYQARDNHSELRR